MVTSGFFFLLNMGILMLLQRKGGTGREEIHILDILIVK